MAIRSEVRAPGKVILLGEHAVVYGQPAIAVPLDRFVRVRCEPAENFELATRPPVGAELLERALRELASKLGEPRVSVHIESELPLSAGLGSSAAVAVAASRALANAASREVSPEALLELAEGLERTFHGAPSGIDHTTCLLAAPIRFERATPHRVQKLRVPEFSFVVASAGPRDAGTREKVMGLRAEHERDPRRLDELFSSIGKLADPGVRALESRDVRALGRLMDANQELLRALGVSTPAIESLCARMKQLGALGAKLTGAGGGGAVIAVHDEPKKLAREIEGAFVVRWSAP